MMRTLRVLVAILGAAAALGARPAGAQQQLLIPMDHVQNNHLKAYGVMFRALQRGVQGEWLLNYRAGSFLLPDHEDVRRDAAFTGVTIEPLSAAELARIRGTIANSNMESVPLERAPKIAVYTTPNSPPWDDAVTMALEYAGIEYAKIWDREVIEGKLADYEWLHLHHEDFTGQYSKFYITYVGAAWLQDEVARNTEMARALGFGTVPELKKEVARRIRDYVAGGGFLFAMCSAPETLELALAAHDVDIAVAYSDGTPPDADASQRMDWSQAMAFQDAQVQTAPSINAFSDIDGHQVNTQWRQPLGAYTLFDFSAKFDPVPSMLTQNHQAVIRDFYGLTTSFRVDRLKPGTTILAREGDFAKYVHGALGQGTFTYLGGHDPADPEHQIGDGTTDLDLHPHDPGYRLILNNVLFPAAKKKTLKT